jgi:hypothetical protein
MSALASNSPADGTPQRAVEAACYTQAGWVTGRFHLPTSQAFSDFLLQSGAFLSLTDAALPDRDAVLPFFALGRDGLRAVAPDPAGAGIESGGTRFTSPWSVTCLLGDSVVEGQIDFLTNQRLSDFLRAARGFILVREASWQTLPRTSGARSETRHFPVLLVNVAQLVGIADAEVQRGHGHPGRLASPSETESG